MSGPCVVDLQLIVGYDIINDNWKFRLMQEATPGKTICFEEGTNAKALGEELKRFAKEIFAAEKREA